MAQPTSSKTDKLAQLASQKPLAQYARDARRKIAVLFTDVVGSTRYFEAQGDIQGRAMLQRHQDVASGAIIAHGGVVVKTIGDSVLAYFLNPGAAMRAAVTVLRHLQQSNNQLKRRDRIRLRIGMHFGDGIIEDEDIFGNVVNLAAKIVSLAKPDQICISGTLRNHVADLEGLKFKHVARTESQSPLEDVDVFRVSFKDDLIFNDSLATLLTWRVVPGKHAPDAHEVLQKAFSPSGNDQGDVREVQRIDDNTLCVVVAGPTQAVQLARNVMGQLVGRWERDHGPPAPLPIQCHIDQGPYYRSGRLFHEDQEINWFSLDPGDIYMSVQAYEALEGRSRIPTVPPYAPDSPQKTYKLLVALNVQEAPEDHFFGDRSVLIRGSQEPCYYCGNRDHAPRDCGSKVTKEVPYALEQIGYRSLAEIQSLFSTPIAHQTEQARALLDHSTPAGRVQKMARDAFYELNYLFQLRFFRKVWDSPEQDWKDVLEHPAALQKGGPVWLGQDCLRVSNHVQAETMFRKALEANPKDYKVHCAWAFLYIERNNLNAARHYFNSALDLATTEPQRIMLRFFLLRLHVLDGPEIEVQKKLRDIQSRAGDEAHFKYHSLKQVLRRPSSEDSVVKQLLKMIETHRWVYGALLIDPDWGRIRRALVEGLAPILHQARMETERLLPEADKALEESRVFFEGDDKLMESLQSSIDKGLELVASDSYFGYLDAYQVINGLILRARKLIVEKRREIKEALFDLRKEAQAHYEQLAKYQRIGKSQKVRHEVVAALDRISATRKQIDHQPELTYAALYDMVEALSQTMAQASGRMASLERIYQFRRFMAVFLQKSIFLQLVNFLIGITLFPILAHYLSLIFPGLSISNRDLWLYQKGFLLIGGVSGILWALYKTLQKLYPDHR